MTDWREVPRGKINEETGLDVYKRAFLRFKSSCKI